MRAMKQEMVPGDVSVGIAVCYPSTDVYFCRNGILNTIGSTKLTVALTSSEAKICPLPSSLPCQVTLYLYKTNVDTVTEARQTWTVTTLSTETKWNLVPYTGPPLKMTSTKIVETKKKLNDGILPGFIVFNSTTPYTFKFTGWNSSIDAKGTVTVASCPFGYSSYPVVFYAKEVFNYTDTPVDHTYFTMATNGIGAPIILFVSGSSAIHLNSKCSYCGQSPIVGVRYQCNECIDYDLCSTCEQNYVENKDDSHCSDHSILKIKVAKVVHEGVKCDSCGVSPIEGVRYQCQVCDNYDLCEKCESNDQHPQTHILLKAKKPLPLKQSKEQKD